MRNAFRTLLTAMVLAVGLGFASAEAAPAGASLTTLKSTATTGGASAVQKAYWVRRCHRVRHHRVVCSRIWVSPRRHYYRNYVHPRHRVYRNYRHYRRHH